MQYLGRYLSYYIQTWHAGRRMGGLELDLDFENVCTDSPPCCLYVDLFLLLVFFLEVGVRVASMLQLRDCRVLKMFHLPGVDVFSV